MQSTAMDAKDQTELVHVLLEEISDAERALRDAPELSFEVVKTMNNWPNKKVTRFLRLTATGVANVRPSSSSSSSSPTTSAAATASTSASPPSTQQQSPQSTPTPATTLGHVDASSFYEYDRIIRVNVLDLNQLSLEYKGAKHAYVYRSPVALQIVQAIQSRVRLISTVKKKRQVLALARAVVASPPTSGSGAGSDSGSDADSSGDYRPPSWRFSRPQSGSPSSIQNSTGDSSDSDSSTSLNGSGNVPGSPSSPSSTTATRERGATARTLRSRKLEHMLGDTEQQRIETTVNTMLLDGTRYEEARAVRQFMDSFNSLEKNPITAALAARNLMDLLKQRLTSTPEHKEQLYAKLAVTGEMKALVDCHIAQCIERVIVTPLYERIMRPMMRVCFKTDNQIERRLDQLRTLSQTQIGVPEKYTSKSGWRFAIVEINDLSTYVLPSQKLQCILDCVQTIIDTAQREFGGSGGASLPADDLLPIFIYVVAHSSLGSLESQSQYMWNLADPDDLTGERGYYLTMFSSVVEYIKNFDASVAVDPRATRTRLASTLTSQFG